MAIEGNNALATLINILTKMEELQAAQRIQDWWCSYRDKKTFAYFRDLLSFKNRGNAAAMLRPINPEEAILVEKCAGVHVRFRLGGASFPPTVFYKIFLHGSVCDVGSFAPRNYAESGEIGSGGAIRSTDGWYQREERNQWRPVALPPEGLEALNLRSDQPASFSHNKIVRKQDHDKKMRERKLKWMRQMYSEGWTQERGGNTSRSSSSPVVNGSPTGELDVDDDELSDLDELLSWSQQLDFGEYVNDWVSLATSRMDEPAPEFDVPAHPTLGTLSLMDSMSYEDIDAPIEQMGLGTLSQPWQPVPEPDVSDIVGPENHATETSQPSNSATHPATQASSPESRSPLAAKDRFRDQYGSFAGLAGVPHKIDSDGPAQPDDQNGGDSGLERASEPSQP